MNYSIIMPFYHRSAQLAQTLHSYKLFYPDRVDYEVIVVVDSKEGPVDLSIGAFVPVRWVYDEVRSLCPSQKYNLGASVAVGANLVFTSPEIRHDVDVLGAFDNGFAKSPGTYLVCACMSERDKKWYQHSREAPHCYHFCSCLSKAQYMEIGGFDERYCGGISYEDAAFVQRIRNNGISVVQMDDVLTTHLEHDRDYVKGNEELVEINKRLYQQQLSTNGFRKP